MFTVITRTSNRPRFFAECRRSVLEQTIHPFHLVGTDDPNDTYPEGDMVVKLPPRRGRESNLHFNDLIKHVPDTHPFVVLLDDDDYFTSPHSLYTIQLCIRGVKANSFDQPTASYLWKMFRVDHLIPHKIINYLVHDPSMRVTTSPKFGNCTGGGICFHKKHWKDWDAESGADYRFISHIYQSAPIFAIDAILTAFQSGPGEGRREDKKE